MSFIIALIAMGLFSSVSFGTSLTATECKQRCEVGPTGWCIGLGASAKQTAMPYIAILKAIQTGLSGKIEDTCNLNISVVDSDLTIAGSTCSIVQESPFSNTGMKTEFLSLLKGTISVPSDGVHLVNFDNDMPVFSWTKQNLFTTGAVPFVISSFDPDGTPKVVWSNGEFCFSALVDYP